MNFILFNLVLVFAGFLAVFILSVGLMACFAPMVLFAKSESPPRAVMLPLLGIAGLYQIYFWGFWSAFCVATTIKFALKPDVTWGWLYWIMGFIWCSTLTGWLAHKERQSIQSVEEVRTIRKGTRFYSVIGIIAFFFFAFSPSLMVPPYGWALELIGLQDYTAAKGSGRVEMDETARKSIEGFFAGYEYSVSANKLARGIANSKDPVGDFEKVRTLLTRSKERLAECDTTLLNRLYNGWGDILSEKLIPGIDFVLAGMYPKGDRNDLARSDALMAQFDQWLHTNWNKILVVLNEKYGFEIRKR